MEQVRARGSRVKVGVCVVVAVAVSGFPGGPSAFAAETTPSPAAESPPVPAVIELAETDDLPGVVIFPARAGGPRPITVVLHGMCGEPIRTCRHFAEQVTANAHLICPRASQRCAGGGVSWPQSGFASAIEAAVTRAKAALPEAVDGEHGRTLIGYSLGAYRALDLAESNPGRYPRVLLIGAKVALDPRLLAANGVARVLLSAGAWDMMHDPMQREAERAARAGVQARFLDLGPVGHAFTPSFGAYLTGALSWLNAG